MPVKLDDCKYLNLRRINFRVRFPSGTLLQIFYFQQGTGQAMYLYTMQIVALSQTVLT